MVIQGFAQSGKRIVAWRALLTTANNGNRLWNWFKHLPIVPGRACHTHEELRYEINKMFSDEELRRRVARML